MESQFLELLLTEDRLGNRVEGTFTHLTYQNILCELQNTIGLVFCKNQLRNNIRTLKHNYNEFKDAFRGMSGFAWHSKKFDAEDDVWETLIQDNPAAASLRHKTCQHWELKNVLWSSSQARGIDTSTAREHFERVRENEESETPNPYRKETNNSATKPSSGSKARRTKGMDTPLPDASDSQAYTGSYRSKMKHKANIEWIIESVGKNHSSSLDNASRAMVESIEIMANKLEPSTERSKNLFNALLGLDLSKEYMIMCYEYLNKHEVSENMFLGLPDEFTRDMWARIMSV